MPSFLSWPYSNHDVYEQDFQIRVCCVCVCILSQKMISLINIYSHKHML